MLLAQLELPLALLVLELQLHHPQQLERPALAQELVLGWPRSVLLGDEKLIVEQHQGIFACTDTEVALKTLCGLLVISGEKLSLSRYDRDGLIVFGKIEKLCYRPKG